LFYVDEDIDSVVKYLFRAEHARAIAEDTRNEAARDILFGLAADYERLALSMERIARADLHLHSSTLGH
jgi:hypothetical protein